MVQKHTIELTIAVDGNERNSILICQKSHASCPISKRAIKTTLSSFVSRGTVSGPTLQAFGLPLDHFIVCVSIGILGSLQ